MEDTTARPINSTELELKSILSEIKQKLDTSDATSTTALENLPTEYDSTTSTSNNQPDCFIKGYNRKVCRYAKKHSITEEEAFKRLYK